MNRLIISNSTHPLYNLLSKLDGFVDYSKLDKTSSELIFDFTALPTKAKTELFSKLNGSIISDLSLNNGDLLIQEFDSVIGAVATVFPSPKSTCETYLKNDSNKEALESFLNELNLSPVYVKSPGVGFVFPRTIAQIINEAWFALEDELATADAIDTAMLFGVNYPKGPLAWGIQAGLPNVVILLEELLETTKDTRYRVCQKLKEA